VLGVRAKTPPSGGDRREQNYQTIDAAASVLAVPEAVSVARGEIVADVREGLRAMAAMMPEDVTMACGPKGKHNPDRAAVRHGSEKGSVTLGARRVPVERPRMCATERPGEL